MPGPAHDTGYPALPSNVPGYVQKRRLIMQNTENKSVNSTRILSVRLACDGLSVSVITPSGCKGGHFFAYSDDKKPVWESVWEILEKEGVLSAAYSSIQLFLDTTDTVFVPEEALTPDNAGDFLRDAGIAIPRDKTVVVSPSVDGLCAVMCFDTGVVTYFNGHFGDTLAWFSPLQENLEIRKRVNLAAGGYILNLTEKNVYISEFGSSGRLAVAEVYPYGTDADIVYYLHRLTAGRKVLKLPVYLTGSRAEQNFRLLKKYFKGVARA